jgi:hypothetical protein
MEEVTSDASDPTELVGYNATCLTFKKNLSFEEWQTVGNTLIAIEGGKNWWVGDWINYGENRFGEKYAQALSSTDFSYGTLRQIASCCSRIPPKDRDPSVRFSMHQILARLEPTQRTPYLRKARDGRLTVSQAKREIEAEYPTGMPKRTLKVAFSDWLERYVKNTDILESEIPHMEDSWMAGQENK